MNTNIQDGNMHQFIEGVKNFLAALKILLLVRFRFTDFQIKNIGSFFLFHTKASFMSRI